MRFKGVALLVVILLAGVEACGVSTPAPVITPAAGIASTSLPSVQSQIYPPETILPSVIPTETALPTTVATTPPLIVSDTVQPANTVVVQATSITAPPDTPTVYILPPTLPPATLRPQETVPPVAPEATTVTLGPGLVAPAKPLARGSIVSVSFPGTSAWTPLKYDARIFSLRNYIPAAGDVGPMWTLVVLAPGSTSLSAQGSCKQVKGKVCYMAIVLWQISIQTK